MLLKITIALEAQAWCLPQCGGSGSLPLQSALTTALSKPPGVGGRLLSQGLCHHGADNPGERV